ncbi:metallophosphoesterase [Vibrio coralliirubri]|uniref:metallophosphoesterase n=1 Tax=Vibrio coralliirubri TaxID=1516159 RepID=UPI0022838B8E|nr:metallophosphoesterase [Vibrio coralliirubri]MCY9861194.1 metallophosphoesterase [Vibrio coralliirubri]
MKKTQIAKFVKFEYEPETDGRVFFVTDIHGQDEMFFEALKMLQFVNYPYEGEKADKLFGLGDMVDRGDGSLNVMSAFRHNPNYESLEGNHERIMYLGTRTLPQISKYNSNAVIRGVDREHWLSQGGDWMSQHDFNAVREMADWADTLPFAAELHIDGKVIGLTHAEVVANELATGGFEQDWFNDKNVMWEYTVRAAQTFTDKQKFNWREAYEYAMTFCRKAVRHNMELNVIGVDAVLHGHTIQEYNPLQQGNSLYFDNGCFIKNTDNEKHPLNILEYAPSEDAILGLFKLYQFYYDDNAMLCIK